MNLNLAKGALMVDERISTNHTVSHDNGPSFLSQLIGLVLVVLLVVGVWALVTDSLPGGPAGRTVSQTTIEPADTGRIGTDLNVRQDVPPAGPITPGRNDGLDDSQPKTEISPGRGTIGNTQQIQVPPANPSGG